ncbi:hypothetical protein [Chryseobacterium sp. R2A-55]|uniref:hypothetical protein n=1 Tax=Chryseobacterium sp. R2A-55 TaxID=2744445 RepID=UPI001F4552B6|nr:hypothetical protein [Chryseobacterium sp. R2A-55]
MMKEYRYHPEIEGLKVNEDGSEVIWNENPVKIKVRDKGSERHAHRFFYFKNKQIGLAKLVLECWKGVTPDPQLMPKHIDEDHNNYHYSNLMWGPKGGNKKFSPKLSMTQTAEILEKLKGGQSGNSLAKEYGVTRTAIYQLRNKNK